MSINGNKLERAIETVMRERGLESPEEVTRLTDPEILICPGIGRKTLNAIREIHPLNIEALEQELAAALRRRKLRAKRLQR